MRIPGTPNHTVLTRGVSGEYCVQLLRTRNLTCTIYGNTIINYDT